MKRYASSLFLTFLMTSTLLGAVAAQDDDDTQKLEEQLSLGLITIARPSSDDIDTDWNEKEDTVFECEGCVTRQAGAPQLRIRGTIPEELRVARRIQFALNSAVLQTTELADAKEICMMGERLSLNSNFAGFMITGHTDVTGSDLHNMRLSKARAQTIANYLAANGCGVEPEYLFVAGKGELELDKNYSNPESPMHRRVEVIAISFEDNS